MRSNTDTRAILKRLHPVAGGIALALIASFLSATVIVEVTGGAEAIATVKRAIVYGLFLLVPAMALAGGSGFRLVGRVPRKGVVGAKARRMPVIAANGLLVLVPCAVALDRLAQAGDFGYLFISLQGLELLAGTVNLALMGLNMRDGLAMTRARRPKRA